jgi:AAA+ ATPase superfamily predicted ATPase
VPRENPFRYGDVATGSSFTDREAELRDLESDIRSGQNVLVLSPRRYGKTSLVVEAVRHLRDQQVLVAYVDLLRATSKAELAGFLATALYQGLVSPVDQAIHRIAEFFGDLPIRPSITLPTSMEGTITPKFEFGAATRAEDADAMIEQLFSLPAQVASKRKRRVALVIDEFQSILELDELLPRKMRAAFQFQPDVSHVYLGSKQHLLHRVFTDANAPLYNSARVLPLGPIPAERFAVFIRERFEATSNRVTPEATAHLLGITGGHPHDTQKLCYFVEPGPGWKEDCRSC